MKSGWNCLRLLRLSTVARYVVDRAKSDTFNLPFLTKPHGFSTTLGFVSTKCYNVIAMSCSQMACSSTAGTMATYRLTLSRCTCLSWSVDGMDGKKIDKVSGKPLLGAWHDFIRCTGPVAGTWKLTVLFGDTCICRCAHQKELSSGQPRTWMPVNGSHPEYLCLFSRAALFMSTCLH